MTISTETPTQSVEEFFRLKNHKKRAVHFKEVIKMAHKISQDNKKIEASKNV